MIFKEQTKSIPITKEMVWESYKKVKSNGGSAGIDHQSLSDFDRVRSKELYKLWNRLYMHYCVDKWLEKYYPLVKMVRYADDLIVHCRSREEAVHTLAVLKVRLTECGLTAHPERPK